MKSKICDSVRYINEIANNVRSVDQEQVDKLYRIIRSGDCLLGDGAGRSYHSICGPAGEAAKNIPRLSFITPRDPGFPGYTMLDAAPKLENMHRKINVLTVSQSGEKKEPKNNLSDLVKHIEKTGTDKFTINAITAHEDSTIGKIAQKYGSMLKLEGTKISKNNRYWSPRKSAILFDQFELGVNISLQTMVEMWYNQLDSNNFHDLVEKNLTSIGKIIDSCSKSRFHEKVVDHAEGNADIYYAGILPARISSAMATVRTHHIKSLYGKGDAYLIGDANTSNPLANDVAMFTSLSGGSTPPSLNEKEQGEPPIVGWLRDYEKLGAIICSIVGTEDSPVADASKHKFFIKEENKEGPKGFYTKANFVHSVFPVCLVERWKERGLAVPHEILDWYHTVAE
jgi:D-arabinose 5-phosphate isomerase GutQ